MARIYRVTLFACFPLEQVIHPKTDEQRKRLAEAVSKSFLFRNMDQEQYDEVLDAIFERQVCPVSYFALLFVYAVSSQREGCMKGGKRKRGGGG